MKTISCLLLSLIFTSNLFGWGEALLKQVAKEVVKEKAKEEVTKAVVNTFTKADPNYQGPKTAEEAAAEANALTVKPLELEAINPDKGISGTKNIKRLKKQTDRVAIAGFRVAFILSNTATASENNSLLNLGNSAGSASGITTIHQDRTVTKEKLLYNISESDMQAIADAAYEQFLAQLAEQGVEVVPSSTVLESEHFAEVETTPSPLKKDSGWFRPNDIYVYSPSSLPLWFGHFDGAFGNKGALAIGTWKKLNKIAHENDVILIVPQFVVNFAAVQSSGRGTMFKKAKVEANTVLHLGQGQTMMHAFHSKKPSAGGDFGTIYIKKPYYMPGEFAVDYLVDESDNATFVNSITRLTGAAGNIKSTETWAVYANPDVFKAYSTQAIGQASAAYVDLLAR